MLNEALAFTCLYVSLVLISSCCYSNLAIFIGGAIFLRLIWNNVISQSLIMIKQISKLSLLVLISSCLNSPQYKQTSHDLSGSIA